MNNIPFLNYHNISKNIDLHNKYTLCEADLERHLSYLSSNSYKSILIDDFLNYYHQKNESQKRLVGITFDDGYESCCTIALPLLKKYNLNATFFITTEWIGQKGYMNPDQLREMKKQGMSLQSHCHSHRFLDDLNLDDIFFELSTSKQVLESILSSKVDFFSCPGGRYPEQLIDIAIKSNYIGFCSSNPFDYRFKKNRLGNFFILGRVNVTQTMTFHSYQKIVASQMPYVIYKRISYRIKKVLKNILGNNLYYFFWKKIMKS